MAHAPRPPGDRLALLLGLANLAAPALETLRRLEWLEAERRRLDAVAYPDAGLLGETPRMKEVHKLHPNYLHRLIRNLNLRDEKQGSA